MAQSEDRFERSEALAAAFDPIIDICRRNGVSGTELESLVWVAFVCRAAATLPGKINTGRRPGQEQIAQAAGLNRNEINSILPKGTKSAGLRMQKKARQDSKSERVLARGANGAAGAMPPAFNSAGRPS